MGYRKQPFIAVFHNDTENNHVHIVSTRVDKETGKKIDDSFERLKAQKALTNAMKQGLKQENEIEKLLNYKIGSVKQLEILLERNGYRLAKNKNDENALDILKNGVKLKSIYGNQLVFNNEKNEPRAKQLKAILNKYKEIYSNKVFRVEDFRKQEGTLPSEKINAKETAGKIEFESELQKKMRDVFGIDVVFHQKDGQKPFGYSVIDHKTGKIYKGSEIMKMNNLFEFTDEKLDKKTFEILKDYNIPNEETKKILLEFLSKNRPKNEVKDFMLFDNRAKKDLETYREIRSDVRSFIKDEKTGNVSVIKNEEGKFYAVHTRHHFVAELQSLVGEKEFQNFLNPKTKIQKNDKNELMEAVEEIFSEMLKTSATAKDPAERELKKRRKKRK
jgi:hypothetical protein